MARTASVGSRLSGLRCLLTSLVAATLCLNACASGPSYEQTLAGLPALRTDQGRIFVYTENRDFFLAVQPKVLVNGEAVGQSKAGTFLVLDEPAGTYEIVAAQEPSLVMSQGQATSQSTTVFLGAGEVTYVQMQAVNLDTAIQFNAIFEDPDQGRQDIQKLEFAGGNVSIASED